MLKKTSLKTINIKLFLSFIFLALSSMSFGQTKHHAFYDARKSGSFHFGFTLGTNISVAKYQLIPTRNETNGRTYVNTIDLGYSPGICIGAIINMHITEHFDIRTSIPSLVIASRTIKFHLSNGTVKNKAIESVYTDIPLLFKYKSERHGNLRFHLIGGAKYAYDFASKQGSIKDAFDPEITYKKHSYYWVYGCGLDMYFEYFKLSPEIRLCNSFNNVLDFDDSIYTTSFSKINNRMIMISFHFE